MGVVTKDYDDASVATQNISPDHINPPNDFSQHTQIHVKLVRLPLVISLQQRKQTMVTGADTCC